MSRPRKSRCINSSPPAVFYKPQGIPLERLRGVTLRMEGFEAMRLVDAEKLSQEEAALRMKISRPTLCRILSEARSVVARALANGWAIRIDEKTDEIGIEDMRMSPDISLTHLGCLERGGTRYCGQDPEG